MDIGILLGFGDLSHAQLVGGFEWRTAAAADDSAAITAGQRIGDFHRACRTVEWFWTCFGSHRWNLAQRNRAKCQRSHDKDALRIKLVCPGENALDLRCAKDHKLDTGRLERYIDGSLGESVRDDRLMSLSSRSVL